MESEIGDAAGKVWRVLEANGLITRSRLLCILVLAGPAVLPAALGAATDTPKLTVKWTKTVGSRGPDIQAPVSGSGDIVAAYGVTGTLHLLDVANGEILRKVGIPVVHSQRPHVNFPRGRSFGNLLVLPVHNDKPGGTQPEILMGIDVSTAKIVWQRALEQGVMSDIGGTAAGYFGFSSFDGHYHLCEAKTGRELWKVEAGKMPCSSGRFDDDTVYIAGSDSVVACDLRTGRERWRYRGGIEYAHDNIALDQKNSVVLVSPVVSGRSLILGLSTKNGAKLWEIEPKHSCAPVREVIDGRFMFTDGKDGTELVAVDALGKQVWQRTFERRIATELTVSGKHVAFFLDGGGPLVVVRAADGQTVATLPVKDNADLTPSWTGSSWILKKFEHELMCVVLE